MLDMLFDGHGSSDIIFLHHSISPSFKQAMTLNKSSCIVYPPMNISSFEALTVFISLYF